MCTTNTPASVRSYLASVLACDARITRAELTVEVGDSDGDHGTVSSASWVTTVTFANGCQWVGGESGPGFGVSDDDLADDIAADGGKLWGHLGALADDARRTVTGLPVGEWELTREELGAPQAPAPVETVAVPAAVVREFFAASAELRAAHASRSPWGAADGRYGVARRALYVALGEAVGDDGHAAA